ncbi:unnamed protein product [Camellia sinensis]
MEANLQEDTLSEEGYLPGTLLHLIKSITGWWVGLFVDLCLSSRLQRWDYWQQIWYYTLKYRQREAMKHGYFKNSAVHAPGAGTRTGYVCLCWVRLWCVLGMAGAEIKFCEELRGTGAILRGEKKMYIRICPNLITLDFDFCPNLIEAKRQLRPSPSSSTSTQRFDHHPHLRLRLRPRDSTITLVFDRFDHHPRLRLRPEIDFDPRLRLRPRDFDFDLQRAAERGGYGGERYEQLDASWKSQKKLYEKHHNTADGRIRIWLGIRQIMNSTDYLLTETRDTAKELKTGIHIMLCSLASKGCELPEEAQKKIK